MGGTAISILGGILPLRANFIFFVLVAVVGYGIYLPYQEKRKYGTGRSTNKKPGGRKAGPGPVVGRIGTLLLCAFLGMLLLWVLGFFLMSLIFAPLMGGIAAVFLVAMGALMVLLLGVRLWRAAHGRIPVRRKQTARLSPASAPESTPEPHDHIPSTALVARERLEQLERLKKAGLVDSAEYERRKETILKEL